MVSGVIFKIDYHGGYFDLDFSCQNGRFVTFLYNVVHMDKKFHHYSIQQTQFISEETRLFQFFIQSRNFHFSCVLPIFLNF